MTIHQKIHKHKEHVGFNSLLESELTWASHLGHTDTDIHLLESHAPTNCDMLVEQPIPPPDVPRIALEPRARPPWGTY
jgi:hypothetical protein